MVLFGIKTQKGQNGSKQTCSLLLHSHVYCEVSIGFRFCARGPQVLPLVLHFLHETDYEVVVVEEDTTLPSLSSSVTTITLELLVLELEPPLKLRITVLVLELNIMLQFIELVSSL